MHDHAWAGQPQCHVASKWRRSLLLVLAWACKWSLTCNSPSALKQCWVQIHRVCRNSSLQAPLPMPSLFTEYSISSEFESGWPCLCSGNPGFCVSPALDKDSPSAPSTYCCCEKPAWSNWLRAQEEAWITTLARWYSLFLNHWAWT